MASNSDLAGTTNFDDAGRISKLAFLVSISLLFVLVIISTVFRLYIRLIVQRKFYIDDGIIIFGVLLLAIAFGSFFHFKDSMYLVEALATGDQSIIFTPQVVDQIFDSRKWTAVCLTILWTAINAVKFSFLALFRRLVARIRPLEIYWWVVFAYTMAVWLFGISAYFVPCPDFRSIDSLVSCVSGFRLQPAVNFDIAQLVLDVVGDILILAIPVRLIWQVRMRWSQKMALAFSLCLSIILIAVTITRAAGLFYYKGTVDVVWGVYWQYISAEVGLILSAATAYRKFFAIRNYAADQLSLAPHMQKHPFAV